MANDRIIDIEINKAQLKRVELMLRGMPRAMPGVLSRAVNRTAISARTQINKEIRQEINIKAADLNEKLILEKAKQNYPVAVIKMSRKRIPVMDFGAKQTAKGVSYKIKKQGGRQTIKSAFITTMPETGHTGVFKRWGKTRLPIVELKGPSIGEVFKRGPALIKRITQQAYKNLGHNIESQLDYVLGRSRTGRAA